MVYIGSVIGAGLPQVCTRGGCADGVACVVYVCAALSTPAFMYCT